MRQQDNKTRELIRGKREGYLQISHLRNVLIVLCFYIADVVLNHFHIWTHFSPNDHSCKGRILRFSRLHATTVTNIFENKHRVLCGVCVCGGGGGASKNIRSRWEKTPALLALVWCGVVRVRCVSGSIWPQTAVQPSSWTEQQVKANRSSRRQWTMSKIAWCYGATHMSHVCHARNVWFMYVVGSS